MITVDRIENGIAVIEGEDGAFFRLPVSQLPEGVREGSVLKQTGSSYQLDADAESAVRKRNAERTRRLFGKKQ